MTRSFSSTLKDKGLNLTRGSTTTLQINTGFLCNLSCKHCHLNGGPSRQEVMARETMTEIIDFAKRNHFEVADITGGAPEMVPDLTYLIDNLHPFVDKMIMRTNLTLLLNPKYESVLDCLKRNRVAVAASFPSINKNQADSQRGQGTWLKSIESLQVLNTMGYGMEGSGLELILISNPTGAFMPPDQCLAEKKFKTDLARKWNIHFTNLFTFANIPLGRFRSWLEKSGNYDTYINKLAGNFNSETIQGLMCRSLISVSWQGYLFDCDFNLAAGLPFSSRPTHVRELDKVPDEIPIATDDHCYGCTAGAGFT